MTSVNLHNIITLDGICLLDNVFTDSSFLEDLCLQPSAISQLSHNCVFAECWSHSLDIFSLLRDVKFQQSMYMSITKKTLCSDWVIMSTNWFWRLLAKAKWHISQKRKGSYKPNWLIAQCTCTFSMKQLWLLLLP